MTPRQRQEEEQEEKKTHAAGGLVHSPSGDWIFEQVESTDPLHVYAYALLKDRKIELGRLDLGIQVFGGKTPVPIEKALWPLSGEPLPYESEEQLYTEVNDYYRARTDLFFDPRLHDLVASWTLATWIWENFQTFPELYVLGPKRSGKSTLLDSLSLVCYRGVKSPNASTSALFRVCEEFHPTLLLDEFLEDSWREDVEKKSLLNGRHKRGDLVLRVEKEGDKFLVKSFSLFGPTAIAGIKTPRGTLPDRCIFIHMEKNIRDVSVVKDDDSSKGLRRRLLSYRFQKVLPEPDAELELPEIRDRRLRELFTPIFRTCPTEDGRKNLLALVREIESERMEEEYSGIEAEVVNALYKLRGEVGKGGLLKNQRILDLLNEARPLNDLLDPKRLGWLLSRLGIRKKHREDGSYALLEPNRLGRLYQRYLPTLSGLSESSAQIQLQTDVSDVPEDDVRSETSRTLIVTSLHDTKAPCWKIQDRYGRHLATLEKAQSFWSFSSPGVSRGVRADTLHCLLKISEVRDLWMLLSEEDQRKLLDS